MALVADIVKVEAPSSAAAGGTVIVDVHTKNLAGDYKYIGVTGVYDSNPLSWQFDYLNVAPGETVVMRGNFTMPSQKVTVWVYTWYWDGSQWVQDATASIDISLAEIVSQVSELAVAGSSKV